MERVAIFGAGGLGDLVRDILLQGGAFTPAAFLDSQPALHGRAIDGLPVLGGLEAVSLLALHEIATAIVAIGDNRARVAVAEQLEQRGVRLASAIHPLASIAPSARIGRHVIIGARVTIAIHSHIGPHSVLSAGSIVDHDGQLGEGVFLHPAVRLAGTVRVDDLATLGIGACVIPGCRIGEGGLVEPGAVVIRDVPTGARVGGVPARSMAVGVSRFVAASCQVGLPAPA